MFKSLGVFDVKLDADVFKEKGNTLVKSQNYEQAIEFYTKAIQVYNKDPVYFCNRALCYLKTNQLKECVEDCGKSIELDANYDKAYYRRMQAYEALDQNILAVKDCLKVMELLPTPQKFKVDYDRLHNNIKMEENERENQKIKWRKSVTAKQTQFVQKAPHLRSKVTL